MSLNAGDLDNDGDLDLHLGTGWMSLSGLVPDLMYANVGGGRHPQAGHFAGVDCRIAAESLSRGRVRPRSVRIDR